MVCLKGHFRQFPFLHKDVMDSFLFIWRKPVIPLRHMDGSIFLPDICRYLRQPLPADSYHLHQKGRRIDAVLSVYMALYRQSA